MKNIWTIMHKELRRVFKSPSMIIALISPGLLIFALYSVIGATTPATGEEQALAAQYTIYTTAMPTQVYEMLAAETFPFDVTINQVSRAEAESKIELVEKDEIQLVIIFDEGFAPVGPSDNSPTVRVYFNPFNNISNHALNFVIKPVLELHRSSVMGFHPDEIFTVVEVGTFDERKAFGGIIADMVPMMLLIFLFAGCMTITAEAIAGEKERGTISTLLATPTKRRDIAIGKIVSLSIIAMLSAISSFLGLVLSLPRLMNISIQTLFGFGEWALVFMILAATVLFIVGMMAVVSTFAKNMKEATMWISVLMFVGIGVSLLTQIIGVQTAFYFYLIPMYNTILSLTTIMGYQVIAVNLLVTFVSNIVYTLIIVWVMTKLFNNERVMFAK